MQVQDIQLGNITVLVNVNLAELEKLLPLGNLSFPQLPSVSLPITVPTLPALSAQDPGTTVLTTVVPSPTDGAAETDHELVLRQPATNINLGPTQTTVCRFCSETFPSSIPYFFQVPQLVDVTNGDVIVDTQLGNVTLAVDNINVGSAFFSL